MSSNTLPNSSTKKSLALVPNQLNITIQTNIPGYQKIFFKPSMVMKEAGKDNTNVQFNPLVKLDKAKIDQVPPNYRTKQFFNKGLFQSLINFTNAKPVETLTLAKRYGYIDQNIRMTLQNIFANGSVITIDGKPYTIADFRWTTGDWKVDTKQRKQELDPNRITDPFLYSQLVKDNLVTAESQLQKLEQESPDIVYGSSYAGPKNATARGPTTGTATKTTGSAPIPTTGSAPIPTTGPGTAPKTTEATAKVTKPPEVTRIQQATFKKDCDQDAKTKLDPTQAKETSRQVRAFFTKPSWLFLLDEIYGNNTEVKKLINQLLQNSTYVAIQSGTQISRNAYKPLVDGLQVNWNQAGGDCFFIAIKDAINYHNCTNPDNPIIKGDGSGDQIFTQQDIRQVVLEFFKKKLDENKMGENGTTYKQDLFDRLNSNRDELNRQFLNTLIPLRLVATTMDETKYLEVANDIYGNGSNEYTFLIEKPDKKPMDPTKPFKIYDNYDNYFLNSYYWGDHLAYQGILDYFKINIIVIKSGNNSNLEVLYQAQLSENRDEWNKYLFLYNKGGHFELLSFTMKFKSEGKRENTIIKMDHKITIFEKGSDIMPPVYILFLIFFSLYLGKTSLQENFPIFTDEMLAFKESYDTIYDEAQTQLTSSSSVDKKFSDFFTNLATICLSQECQSNYTKFNFQPPPPPLSSDSIKTGKRRRVNENQSFNIGTNSLRPRPGSIQVGGAYPSFYPSSYQEPYYSQEPYYYQQPYYNRSSYYPSSPYNSSRPYLARNMIKNESEYDPSKLAFDITIALELYPGANVPKEKLATLKCDSRWEDVRKAWSEFIGKPYVIIPKYSNSYNNQTQRYNPKSSQNQTQRYQNNRYQNNRYQNQTQRQRYQRRGGGTRRNNSL